MHATRAAIAEGVVAGGGVALIRAGADLDKVVTENEDQKTGVNIIRIAIEAPLRTIIQNCGLESSVIVNKVKEGEGDFGYNAREDRFDNLIKIGVLDPAKVTRLALENASSISGLLLTTDCVVADDEEAPAPAAPMGGGGMGGMY